MTIPAESEASVCGTSRWRHRWAGVRAGSREKPGTPLGRRQHRPLRAASAKACGTTAGAAGGREVRAGRQGPRRGGGMAIFHLIIKSLIIVSGTLFGIFETLTTDASFCRHVFKLLKGLKEFDSNHGT